MLDKTSFAALLKDTYGLKISKLQAEYRQKERRIAPVTTSETVPMSQKRKLIDGFIARS